MALARLCLEWGEIRAHVGVPGVDPGHATGHLVPCHIPPATFDLSNGAPIPIGFNGADARPDIQAQRGQAAARRVTEGLVALGGIDAMDAEFAFSHIARRPAARKKGVAIMDADHHADKQRGNHLCIMPQRPGPVGGGVQIQIDKRPWLFLARALNQWSQRRDSNSRPSAAQSSGRIQRNQGVALILSGFGTCTDPRLVSELGI